MARYPIALLLCLLLSGVLQAAPVAIALHGGAGTLTRDKMTPEQERTYLEILDTAVELGHERLQAGAPGSEVVREVIRLMEDSPLFNAGLGAVFTWDGRHELDASIMLGESLRAGAVAGVTRVKNPIEAAISKIILRDILDREQEEADDDKVQMLTLHAAKGLEFLHVFLIGMEEDILPHRNSIEDDQIEEERRLAYVGITRAQRTLTMTSAAQRTQFGETGATTPSRFINELPQDDIVHIGGNSEASAEQNQVAGEQSLDALKSLFA